MYNYNFDKNSEFWNLYIRYKFQLKKAVLLFSRQNIMNLQFIELKPNSKASREVMHGIVS